VAGVTPPRDAAATLDRRIQPRWLRGFDVSKFQLEIDFAAARAGGIRFGWIREGESNWSTPDDKWSRNWPACHAAGIPCGPYHPVHGDAPGAVQARIFRDRCKDWEHGLALRPAIDLETRGGAPLHEAEAMAEETERLFGVAPILYVGRYFAREIGLTRKSPLARLLLWLPAYDTDAPQLPDAWDRWHVWQLSGNGTAPGVSTACDLNVVQSEADLDEILDVSRRGPVEVPRADAVTAPLATSLLADPAKEPTP
jgi:lysozyme